MPVCKMTNGQNECPLQGTVPPQTDIPDKMFSQGQHRMCGLGLLRGVWPGEMGASARLVLAVVGHSTRLTSSALEACSPFSPEKLSESQQNSS